MKLASAENVIRVLSTYNPWWRTGAVPSAFQREYKRFAYYEASRHLEHADIRRHVVLTGTRRVGKTTIQYQMIDHLIHSGVDPNRILFVSLDHPLLKLCPFNEILDIYHTNIYGDQDVYYFFDEIQYAADWDQWMKTLFDTQPLSKIVATGSASPVLKKKAGESGVGRWTVVQVPTLSFYEYCELLSVPDRPALPAQIRPTGLGKMDRRMWAQTMTRLSGLQKHFHRYLQVGGFPELALSKDDFMAQQAMREDVVDKVLKRDIPALYNIRNSTEMERVFLYLCFHSSSIISIEAITKELGSISRSTVEDYIDHLESANLIYRSYPIDLSGKKVLKAKTKIYIADAAIRNAVLMRDDLLTNPEEMGIMVETAVYKHIAAFYFQNTTRIGYYRESGKAFEGNEIDVVVEYPTGRIMIEVKYREQASIGERDAIYRLAGDADASIVVTKREEDYGMQSSASDKAVIRIPAYAFLYLLGNAEKHGYRGYKA